MTGLTRRQVAKGAAWMTPVIAAAAAAPAMAASPNPSSCTPSGCPSATLNTTDWAINYTSIVANTGTTGMKDSWTPKAGYNTCSKVTPGDGAGTAKNVAVGEGDPSSRNGYLIFSKTVCLKGGATITASYDWLTYGANNRGATMQLYVEPYSGQTPSTTLAVGGAAVGGAVTAPAKSLNAKGSVSGATYTVPVTGQYMIKIVWTFDNTGTFGSSNICDYGTNDIGMYNLAFSCVGAGAVPPAQRPEFRRTKSARCALCANRLGSCTYIMCPAS